NEALRAEAGAMMAMSPDIQVTAKAEGGVMKSLKRATLGGESIFMTTYTAGPAGGWVDLAANLPGDLQVVEVQPGRPWLLSKTAYLGAGADVYLDTKLQGVKMFAGGEGAFLLEAGGQGTLVVAAYGAIDRMTLAAGQSVTVDSDHFVAAEQSVQYEIAKASSAGWVQSAKTGEAFVFHFTGPGELMMQSRSPRGLVAWLAAHGLGNRG
ncbi:MAG: TIGR00266 family protein, partial [Aquihabitans sp.]